MFEPKHAKLLPRPQFIRRLGQSVLTGAALIAVSLSVGIAGYHWLAKLEWLDAYLDAAMILSGMGQVSTLHTVAGKIFAGAYAIYCGVALIATTGIILAPVVHRAMHKFHLQSRSDD